MLANPFVAFINKNTNAYAMKIFPKIFFVAPKLKQRTINVNC